MQSESAAANGKLGLYKLANNFAVVANGLAQVSDSFKIVGGNGQGVFSFSGLKVGLVLVNGRLIFSGSSKEIELGVGHGLVGE